ncbi:MAG: SDR family oxidoreductase [Solirubrobacterales bacterium]|nr:SDR family oxidoreductase [Solirubrobacterales bacterium]MBV9796610.1 SDR family oxidoreductase [Solirubrobacterales bacterium]
MSRTVVVTGGAKGIGRAIVERFAALGDDVVALGRDREALSRLQAEQAVRTERCDVTDEQAVIETFGRLGDVDVLVNNAGFAESAPLARTTLASWGRHFDTNVTGPFLCMRAVLPRMRERGAGAMITVASVAGRIGAPYTSAYTASKHAAVGLMRAVASEVAGTGVRANAVCPAYVRTELTDRAIARIVEVTRRTEAESEQALADKSPLHRLLDPGEVADAVVFLASPAAVAINGQALVIDGGGIQA